MAQRYVNTGASPGGNGTTNATTGANRAYNTLSVAEAAIQGTYSEIWTVDCTGTSADTTAVTIDGSTSTASFYLRIRAASGQEAVMPWSTSRYRLSVAGNALTISDDHVRVERIQAETTDAASSRTVIHVSNPNVKLIKCLARYGTSTPHTGYDFRDLNIAENCIVIGNNVAGSLGFTSTSGADTVRWYNCMAINCATGFDFTGTTTILKNCLGHGSATADYDGTFGSGSTDNASEDATAGGTNPETNQTFTFVDAGAGDYNLDSSDTGAKDLGADLSGDADWPFSTDFNGATRSGSWDIGATEVAGGTVHQLTAAAAGVAASTTTENTAWARSVAVAGQAVSTITANVVRALTGSVAGVGAATVTEAGIRQLTVSAAGVAEVTAQAGAAIRTLAADVAGQAAVTVTAAAVRALTSSVAGVGTSDVTLYRVSNVTGGLVSGVGAASADLDVVRALSISVAGVATTSASLTASGTIELSATVSGQATVTVDLDASYALTSSVAGVAASSASLLALRYRDTAAAGVGTSSAALAMVRALSPNVAGTAAVSAQLAVMRALSASVAGAASAEATLETAETETPAAGKYAELHAWALDLVRRFGA